jgi:hypothetical protein
MRDTGFQMPSGGPAVRIDAMPFARTVTCSDYTLTGTAPGAGAVTWAASPSGDSGACTGTTSWSCVVNVDPNAVGEGVEVITVTQGTLTDTETIGFYVDGEHSCFLAQSIDGTYNSGKANLDAVATWENLGSSALDVTQGTGTAQPTYRTGIVGGQPVVRCDGGDFVAAATAADWAFLHDGNGATIDSVSLSSSAAVQTFVSTSTGGAAVRGIGHRYSATFAAGYYMSDGTALRLNIASAINLLESGKFNNYTSTLASADTPDLTGYVNGSAAVLTGDAAAFSALAPASPLTIGSNPTPSAFITGDLFRVIIYSGTTLTSTQIGINKAVDEWALGGSLPVTP